MRVGGAHFNKAHIEVAANMNERVFVTGGHGIHFTDIGVREADFARRGRRLDCGLRGKPSSQAEPVPHRPQYQRTVFFIISSPKTRTLGYFSSLSKVAPTLSIKAWVVKYFCSLPTRRAKSLVMSPASTVWTQAFSSVSAKAIKSSLPSNLPRYFKTLGPRKIEAIGLVEVSLPFWYSR